MVGNVWEFVNERVKPDPVNVTYFAKKLNPPPGPAEPWVRHSRRDLSDMPLAKETKPGDFVYKGIWDDSAVPARWKDSKLGFRCVKDAAVAH